MLNNSACFTTRPGVQADHLRQLYILFLEAKDEASAARKARKDARRQLETATLAQAARLLGDRP